MKPDDSAQYLLSKLCQNSPTSICDLKMSNTISRVVRASPPPGGAPTPDYRDVWFFWAADAIAQTAYCHGNVCLSTALCIVAKRSRLHYSVYRSRIGMWGGDFDWYHFRPPMSTLTVQNGGRIGWFKLWHWNCGQMATDKAKNVLTYVGRSCVGFPLV